ncbi:MAG: TetR/AcrR family transcriptional regulator, partial [Thermoleophilaceae bacterium]|nr:TetR/AcrR family transcriptional regulator [Thermoleophilaceae bacterium]
MPKVVDHEQRRTEVAAAARAAIADRGLDGATVRDIAAAAGVSTGVLAYYFRDKDELLLQALRDSYEAAAGRMLRAGRRNPGLEA